MRSVAWFASSSRSLLHLLSVRLWHSVCPFQYGKGAKENGKYSKGNYTYSCLYSVICFSIPSLSGAIEQP